jgi:hypothetical protein
VAGDRGAALWIGDVYVTYGGRYHAMTDNALHFC